MIFIIILIVSIIAIASFYLLYIHEVNYSNRSALIQLNSQINVYGANMRYLLNNSTLYNQLIQNPINYQTLLNLSSPFNSIDSVLNASDIKANNSDYNNFGSYNSNVRKAITNNLTMMGVLSPSEKSKILRNSDSLEDLYVFILAANNALLYTQLQDVSSKGDLFSNNAVPRSVDSKTIAIFDCGLVKQNINESSTFDIFTSIEGMNNSCVYNNHSMEMVSLPLNLMDLISNLNGKLNYLVKNKTMISNNTNSITLYKLFYSTALTQYESYELYEFLYNRTIPPSLDEIIYTNNTLLVNLGNLNLVNTPNISLEVNGTGLNYKRYFDWIVATNVSLPIGKHEIEVKVSNTSLSDSIYVSPYIFINHIATTQVNNNGTYIPAKLNVKMFNTVYKSMTINSIRGPFLGYGPAIINKTSYTNGLVLARNSSFSINYTMPDGCYANEGYLYKIEFNTSDGPAIYWLRGSCYPLR